MGAGQQLFMLLITSLFLRGDMKGSAFHSLARSCGACPLLLLEIWERIPLRHPQVQDSPKFPTASGVWGSLAWEFPGAWDSYSPKPLK